LVKYLEKIVIITIIDIITSPQDFVVI